MKLIIVDLDGTLFDTKEVNYNAYKEAIKPYGYQLDYEYYCNFCNGRHYLDFLPQITTTNKSVLTKIHKAKKDAYKKHLDKAVLNQGLVDILHAMKGKGCKIAVVTTASKQNCYDILYQFNIFELFDLVLTHDDITNVKPDPEGFFRAMELLKVKPEDTIIFEDSEVGIEAAIKTKASLFVVKGFN
ncbi:MAG: HAD family hydrolase [Bacillus sp. (in: firmicutes)]